MSERCGKTAQCYDDLLKMLQNKDISTIVLFSKFEQEHILYKQQYVDKLNARIHDLQEENKRLKEYQENYRKELDYWRIQFSNKEDRIDKAIEVLKLCNSKCSKEIIDILRGDK